MWGRVNKFCGGRHDASSLSLGSYSSGHHCLIYPLMARASDVDIRRPVMRLFPQRPSLSTDVESLMLLTRSIGEAITQHCAK